MSMSEYEKLLIAFKAMELGECFGSYYESPEQMIDEAKRIADKCFPRVVIPSNAVKVSEADINEIYAAYPSKDYRNDNRSTCKGRKCKDKIANLLASGESKEHILQCIKDAESGSAWLPNFETFLNNLPEEDEGAQPKKQPETIWQ